MIFLCFTILYIAEMRKIILLIFLFFSMGLRSQCLKADIIIMMDWSGSESDNGQYITSAANDFIYSLDMGPSSVKVGVIPFDWLPKIPWCVPLTWDKSVLSSVVNNLGSTFPSGITGYEESLYLARQFFKKSQEERGEEVIKIIILISDGEETEISTNGAVSLLKSENCLIWCIGTSSSKVSDEGRSRLLFISSGPEFYSEQTYYTLRDELLRLNICP